MVSVLQVHRLNNFPGHEICYGHVCFARADMFGCFGHPSEKKSTFSRHDRQFWPISAHRMADLHVHVNKIGHDRVLIVSIVSRRNRIHIGTPVK